MSVKNEIIGLLFGLFDELTTRPLPVFMFFYLIFHYNNFSLLLFIFTLFFSILKHNIILYRYDINKTIQLLNFLNQYDNYKFYKIDLRSIINKYSSYEDIQGILHFNGSNKEIATAYEAEVINRKGARLLSFKVFPRAILPSILIFPKINNIENFTIIEQFKLFHEIGHLSKKHSKIETIIDETAINSIYILFISAVFLGTNSIATFFIFFIVFIYMMNFMILYKYSMNKEHNFIERIADSFSLSQLINKDEFSELEKILTSKKIYGKENWQETYYYFKKWFGNPVDVKEFKIFSILKKIPGDSFARLNKYSLSIKGVNYNSLLDQFYTPKKWVAFSFLLVLISSAYITDYNIILKDFIVLSSVLLALPAIYMIRLYIQLVYCERIVLSLLRDINEE